MKVFISGSIEIKTIHKLVMERLNNIISSNYHILIGDALGVDSTVQQFLNSKKYSNVTIFFVGDEPRNNIGNWPTKKIKSNSRKNTRSFFTAKDIFMAKECDYGFMIWDSRSTGTLSNIYELLIRNKASLVFVNKQKKFYTVNSFSSFEKLLSVMYESSYSKADKKINLTKKISFLKNKQLLLFEANKALQGTAVPLPLHSRR